MSRPGEVPADQFGFKKLTKDTSADIKVREDKNVLREAKEAIQRYDKLVEEIADQRQVLAMHQETLDLTYGRSFNIHIPQPKIPERPAKDSESAVLVFSDSHIWKIVERSTTLEFGHYNPKVFLDRLHYAEQTVMYLLKHHVANPIRKLHIMFLGDIVEGSLSHSQELAQRGHQSDQILFATFVLYQFVARLAQVVDIECHAVVGNHGRWGTQKKMPTEGRFSNFDMIVMGQVSQLLKVAGHKNVKFEINDQPFQVVDIEGHRFYCGHGDHLRGGDKAVGVPSHAIGRQISATNARYASRRAQVPDYYIVGDKHRHIEVPTATGAFMIGGAWFADDDYAMMANFSPNKPEQLFFGVHPKQGRSWQFNLHLHLAKPTPIQYDIPEHLLRKIKKYKS